MKNDTIQIKSIAQLLERLNLSPSQKHNHFHIIRFKDDINKLPKVINLKSENYFEITVIRNANNEVLIDQTKIHSKLDMITFLSPGQTININRNNEGEFKEGFILLFTVDFLDFSPTIFNMIQRFPYFNMHISPVYVLNNNQSNFFFELMDKIYTKFKHPSIDNFEIIKSYLTILLFETKQFSNELINNTHSRAEEITFQFENLLKQEDKKALVKEYADELNISPIYLSECIKSTTGKSAKKIIIEYKMREAKSLLSFSEKTIDEIAGIIGFDDRSNFINFFKKNAGFSPNKFRKEKRQNHIK